MNTARIARRTLALAEGVGLLVIAIATVVAGVQEVQTMWHNARVTLADLLLMFIYLEVLAMVGLFYSSGALPVQVPIFIAIVALARYLILDTKDLHEWRVLAVAAAICLLAIAAWIVTRGMQTIPAATEGTAARDPDRGA